MSRNINRIACAVFTVGVITIAVPARAVSLAVLYDYEDSGDLGNDVSGNGNDGTINGTVTSAAGRNGSSLGAQFPGVAANNISRGALSGGYDGLPGLTMMSWIWVDSTNPTFNGIISQGGADHRLMINPSRQPFYSAPDTADNPQITYDTWYHLALTKENSGSDRDVVIYVNGVASDNSPFTHTGNLTSSAASSMFVGAGENSSAWPFKGVLDDSAIFDGAMTGPQVAATYNLAVSTALAYDLQAVSELIEVFEATTGSAIIGDETWEYATGLTGTPGVVQFDGLSYFVVLDELGNGVMTTFFVPEPSTFALAGLGLAMFAMRRRRRN